MRLICDPTPNAIDPADTWARAHVPLISHSVGHRRKEVLVVKKGETKDIGGGATREYYSERWDVIKDKDGNSFWRDKENHKTYEHDGSIFGTLVNDCLGSAVDRFDNEDED